MSSLREHWGSKLGFIMAAIGSAIGLGILWKFPYVVGRNGGALFFLSYLFCVIIVGLPLFIGELVLGRSAQKAAVMAILHHEPNKTGWKIAAWLGVASSFLIMSFYSVIAGYGMSYILLSLNGFYQNLTLDQVSIVYERLSQSGPISLFWHFLFTLITAMIVFLGVRKGIEYWSKIMVKVFLILMLVLFLYSLTLPGFSKAVDFAFKVRFDQFSVSSFIEALGLALFTLSLGQGIMISYGSYMSNKESIFKTSCIVAFSVVIVAGLSALTIFPVVFTFNVEPNSGPGLVFKTLPYLFAKLPSPMLISGAFFTLFVFTALTSAVPLIEVVATNLMELCEIPRKKAVMIVAIGTFVFGIPSAFSNANITALKNWNEIYGMGFLETIDHLVSTWIIPLAGLLTAVFVGWKVNKEVAFQQFCENQERKVLFLFWHFTIRYIVPAVSTLILLQGSGVIDISKWLSTSS
jgi:NSS family neurotransmitter:Na+ symporter